MIKQVFLMVLRHYFTPALCELPRAAPDFAD
jgi:hypothetical protein